MTNQIDMNDIDNSLTKINKWVDTIIQFVPIILISYFILYSILNNSLSGIVLIIGIAISLLIITFIGNSILSTPTYNKDSICNFISINHKTGISNVPFSQIIFGFILSYLLFTIIEYGQGIRNMQSLFIFATVILIDMYQLIKNKCFPIINILFGFACSLLMGGVWGNVLNNPKYKRFQYVIGEHKLCMMPSEINYSCGAQK